MTVLAALAARAAAQSEEPWLFYRRGWDWRWRSWGQVADQVARSAATLRRSPALAGRSGPGRPGPSRPAVRGAFDGRQHPDAVAAGLAIQAVGATAVPRSAGPLRPVEVAVLQGGDPAVRLRLPICRSRLERWRPRALDLEAAPAAALAFDPASATVSQQQMDGEAERLALLLPAAVGRPILCASAALDPRALQILLAWAARTGAAWILEPDAEAFPAAARWARPTLVVATGGELEGLAAALDGGKRRRHRRLAAVVAVGEPAGREGWEELGVPVVEWAPGAWESIPGRLAGKT